VNQPGQPLVIRCGRLVDGSGRPPITDAVVIVVGDRILNAGPAGAVHSPQGAEVLDLGSATVTPGLFDGHVHVGALPHNRFGVDDPDSLADAFMATFVTQGVTTVRCTGSPDLGPAFRLMKASGPSWPRFYGSGPNLDGAPGGPHPGLRVVTTPGEARDQVVELLAGGADFIKAYAWMREAELAAVVAEAHASGARVAAHVGHVLTAIEAASLGVDCLEHVRVGRELLTDEGREAVAALPPRRYDALFSFRSWRHIDPDGTEARRLVATLADLGVRLCPTLSVTQAALLGRLDPDVRHPEGSTQLPQGITARWEQIDIAQDYGPDDLAATPVEFERVVEFVGHAHAAGVRIVAGTDVPNPFVVPGHSLHQELELLVRAGLTPAEAIVAATREAASLLGIERELGTIEGGKLADLVVFPDDPTRAIGAVRAVAGVMKGGVWVGDPPTTGTVAATA
jgi:imidazolonepropionase-like amidohydrolase